MTVDLSLSLRSLGFCSPLVTSTYTGPSLSPCDSVAHVLTNWAHPRARSAASSAGRTLPQPIEMPIFVSKLGILGTCCQRQRDPTYRRESTSN